MPTQGYVFENVYFGNLVAYTDDSLEYLNTSWKNLLAAYCARYIAIFYSCCHINFFVEFPYEISSFIYFNNTFVCTFMIAEFIQADTKFITYININHRNYRNSWSPISSRRSRWDLVNRAIEGISGVRS